MRIQRGAGQGVFLKRRPKNEDLRPLGLKRRPLGLERRPHGLKRTLSQLNTAEQIPQDFQIAVTNYGSGHCP